jgi:hypothetical protein
LPATSEFIGALATGLIGIRNGSESKVGCSKTAALEHLRRLSETPDLAERGQIIACWRQTTDHPAMKCENDGLDR